PVRYALIEKYCPSQGRDSIKTDEANKDCLVRPYMGRLRYGSGGQFFSLRNFKLHASQMKDLDLATAEMCRSMAHALALLHWHAKIDGMDIEFVLGSSPVEEQKIRTEITLPQVMALRNFNMGANVLINASLSLDKPMSCTDVGVLVPVS
ncbi:hypothetical protein QBC46DRAFT_433743, partial [Diplogelasinospora grovesii]